MRTNGQAEAAFQDGGVWAGWTESFAAAVQRIRALLEHSEAGFLDVGSALNGLAERCREISGRAAEAAAGLGGEGMGAALSELRRELDALTAFTEKLHREDRAGVDALQRLLGEIDGLASRQSGFRKIVRVLRVLAISTRIESSRLGSAGAGFHTLADDVEKLAHLIETKSSLISSRCRTLRGRIEEVRTRTGELLAEQGRTVEAMVREAGQGVEALGELIEGGRQASGRISGHLEGMAAQIGEVVTSLQFHDITRQQLEHVVSALGDLEARALDPGGDEAARRESAGWIGDVVELERRQVEHTAGQIREAVRRIAGALSDIAGTAETLTEEIRGIVSRPDGGSDTLLSRISAQVESVLERIGRNASRSVQMHAALQSVGATVKETETFVTAIGDIGAEIELIALNARVKSAHTGDEGRALGVLAEAIQRLAVDARAETAEVSDFLGRITREAENLHAGDPARGRGEGEPGVGAGERLAGLLDRLRGLETEFIASESALAAEAEDFSRSVRDLAAGLDYHERAGTELGAVDVLLGRILEEARRLMPIDGIEDREERLRILAERYTMASERDVHASGFGQEEGGAGTPAPAGPDEDGLGDNVELF